MRVSKTERKRLILEAAIVAFSKKGFSATQTSSIAIEADVSEALIYKHFKSKEALFLAVSDHIFLQVRQQIIRGSILTHGPVQHRFEILAKNFYKYYKNYPEHIMLLFSTMSEWDNEIIYEKAKRSFKLLHKYQAFLLFLAQMRKEISWNINRSHTAWMILNMFQSVVFHEAFEIHPPLDEEAVVTGIRIIFAGLQNVNLTESQNPKEEK